MVFDVVIPSRNLKTFTNAIAVSPAFPPLLA